MIKVKNIFCFFTRFALGKPKKVDFQLSLRSLNFIEKFIKDPVWWCGG